MPRASDHGSAASRRRAAATAGHRADEAGARGLTHDPDPGVRATALTALARLDALDDTDLSEAARDLDAKVRRRAAELAATHTAPILLDLLADPDATVVEMAAWACGERSEREPGDVDALVGIALAHEDALCREAAVAALGSLQDPAGLPTILAALGDKATVRRRAVIALAPFEGPEVDDALRRHLDDRDWQVRQAAEDLLRPGAAEDE